MSILQIVAYVSVITNAALICFTMKLFQASPQGLVWIFISYQYIILIIMQAFDYYIDDVSISSLLINYFIHLVLLIKLLFYMKY